MLIADIQTSPLLQAPRAGAGLGFVLQVKCWIPAKQYGNLSSYADKNECFLKSHATDFKHKFCMIIYLDKSLHVHVRGKTKLMT